MFSKSIANATLSEMANANIRRMDFDELTDLSEIEIDSSLPVKDRVKQFVEKVGNPYCYKSHGVKIKLCFGGEKSLADCLSSCMSLGATMFGTENHTSIGEILSSDLIQMNLTEHQQKPFEIRHFSEAA